MNVIKAINNLLGNKEKLQYVVKLKSMLNKGVNIPYVDSDIREMPKGFTPSTVVYTKKNTTFNPQISKYIPRNGKYNMPKVVEDKI